MTRQIKPKPEKPLTRRDVEKEILRIENLLKNYKSSPAEKVYFKNYLKQLKQKYDELATKKLAKEANL